MSSRAEIRADVASLPSTGTGRDLRRLADERFRLRCPVCRAAAFSVGDAVYCPEHRIPKENGLLPLLSPEKRRELAPFLDSYRRTRRSEGWSGAASYYLGLPFASDGRHRSIWKIRARSYRSALRALADHFPDGKRADEWGRRSLRILETGAGNGWFSWRMAEAGHSVLATDISLDDEDGLGAIGRYAPSGPALRDRLARALADMEDLLLDDGQFDVVVSSASLHYARDLSRAVSEAHRVLAPGGLWLVLDSPVFAEAASGDEMVRERRRRHQELLGAEPADPTVGYLVASELVDLLTRAGFRVRMERVFEGLSRSLGRGARALRRLTAPARFPLFVAEKEQQDERR